MPRVIAMHDVDDAEFWLASPKRDELFADVATNIVTFVHPELPNKVGISMTIPDLDAFLARHHSPEGEAAMVHDGVRRDTVVFMVEA